MSRQRAKGKAEQLKAIHRGKGIQHILDTAHKILGNPMLVFDMEYKLIAFSQTNIDDDPIWSEFMENGKLSAETIGFCMAEGFIDDVANSTLKQGITYLTSNKLKYNRIFGQLYNSNRIPVADLVAVECESPFEEDTPALIAIICDLLSKELGKKTYYQDYGQQYQEAIIKQLIEGSIADSSIYTGHVANIDAGLKKNIFVAVVGIPRGNIDRDKLVYYRDLLKQTQPAFKYYIYCNRIVILMSWDDSELDQGPYARKELRKLRQVLDQEGLRARASSCFENLFALGKYYNEAADALDDDSQNPDR